MVSWGSRKQRTIADSPCYAECIALREASHEAVFLRQFLKGANFLPTNPTPIHCGNAAATQLMEDRVWHSHRKRIRVKYHRIRELVADNQISISRIRTQENAAGILTKPLSRGTFQHLRAYLGVLPSPKPGRA
jgi:hypothetical protein